MSTTAQKLGQAYGVNMGTFPAPSSAPVPPTQTEEDQEFEIRPGVMFDPSIEDTRPRAPLFGLEFLEGVPIIGDLPPNVAAAEPDPRYRLKSEKIEEETTARLSKAIGEAGGTYDPEGTEIKNILDGKGMYSFGFVETADEAKKVFEEVVGGDKEVRIFEDTDPRTIFSPQFYVSIEKDDGTFTPYASPLQTTGDYAKMIAGQAAFEIPAGSGTVATAWGTSAAVTTAVAATATVLPPMAAVAPIAGAVTFVYMLYAGGGTAEKFKQDVLKDQLGLTDKEADEAETLLGQIVDTATEGYVTGEFTAQERMAGLFELGGGLLGSLFDKARLTLGRRGQAFLEDAAAQADVYPSARAAQEAAAATRATPGSPEAMVDGVDMTLRNSDGRQVMLGGMTLKDITDNRIIGRLAALAEQTSVILPRKIKESAQSAVEYLRTYKDNLGGGDFGLFRRQLRDLQDFFSANRDKTPDFKKLGTSIMELDQIFRTLRFDEAKGLYANVFDRVGTMSYDMTPVVDRIIARTRTIVPELDEAGKRAAGEMALQPGEPNLFGAINALKMLGNEEAGGRLTYQGMDAAIAAFNKENPAYAISRTSEDYVVDTPAKLLQMFAIRFGEMASDIAAMPTQTMASKNARKTAMDMRDTLLDLIANPEGADDALKATLKADLDDANAFYRETYTIVENAQTRTKTKVLKYTEPGQFARDILNKGPGTSMEEMLEAIGKQQDYVMSRLADAETVNNPMALQQLQQAFREIVDMKIALSMPGRAGEPSSPTALRDYLFGGSGEFRFSDEELELLGFDRAAKEQAIRDADQLAELASGDFVAVVGKDAAASSPFLLRFKDAFSNPTKVNDNLKKLIDVSTSEVAGAGGMENLRKGFFDYLVSTQSGVLKRVESNTPYQNVGDFVIDSAKLGELLDLAVEGAPELARILSKEDMAVLKMLQGYTATLNRAGADAGSALAGAQIIGELFTVDPKKFASGLARLAAQQRISKIFSNDKVVDAAVGLGAKEVGGMGSTIKTYFSGYGALGAIIANTATGESPEAAQTREALEASRRPTSPTVDALMQQFQVN